MVIEATWSVTCTECGHACEQPATWQDSDPWATLQRRMIEHMMGVHHLKPGRAEHLTWFQCDWTRGEALPDDPKELPEWDEDEAVRLHEDARMSPGAIALLYREVSGNQVREALKARGCKLRGVAGLRLVIDPLTVAAVKRRWRAGITRADIAAEFGLSMRKVKQIIKGMAKGVKRARTLKERARCQRYRGQMFLPLKQTT